MALPPEAASGRSHPTPGLAVDTSHIAAWLLDLSLEFISLLTGETFTAVKSGDLVAIMAPKHHLLLPKNNNWQRLLQVTRKMTELLTGEVPIRYQDVAVYLSIEEREYLEGHEESYRAAMLEEQPADPSRRTQPPERCLRPLYSQDSTQEHQAEEPSKLTIQMKGEIKGEEDEADGLKYLEGRQEAMMEAWPPLKAPADGSDPSSTPEDHTEERRGSQPEVTLNVACVDPARSSHVANLAPACRHSAPPSDPRNWPHQGDSKRFPCPKCERSFRFKAHLVCHQKTHTGPFSCPECGKMFPQREALRSHLISHTTERPFSCSECDQRFKRKRHLLAHRTVHSSETPFSCPECGKSYKWIDALIKHQRLHTGVPPFMCPQCGKGFRQKESLTRHHRAHNGSVVAHFSILRQKLHPEGQP